MNINLQYSRSQYIIMFTMLGVLLWSFTSKEIPESELNQSTKKIYCQLYVNNQYTINYTSQKLDWVYTIDVNYGNYVNYTNKDAESLKVKTFTNYLDALNYLGERGWHLVLNKRHMIDGYLHYEDHYLLEKTIQ